VCGDAKLLKSASHTTVVDRISYLVENREIGGFSTSKSNEIHLELFVTMDEICSNKMTKRSKRGVFFTAYVD
jgi:hypothetical protein